MYDKRLEKLLFQVQASTLGRRAGEPGRAIVPGRPLGDRQSNHDDLSPMKGILLAVALSIAFWLTVFIMVARKLM